MIQYTDNLHIFVLDNNDSFIFNLVDFLYTLTPTISIYRQDTAPQFIINIMTKSRADGKTPLLLLSPGPKAPSDIPNMMTLLKLAQGTFPILGICLGHQAIIEHYGGTVGACEKIMHGKTSLAHLSDHKVFETLEGTLLVARYHSLTGLTIPKDLTVIAKTDDAIMGVADDANRVIGFQFHPESILTVQGEILLKNTINHLTKDDFHGQ